MNTITEQIQSCADAKNAAFAAKLIPNIPPETVLGCRTPDLRKLAAALGTESDAVQAFLHTLPHRFFDENQLHAFLLCRIRSFLSSTVQRPLSAAFCRLFVFVLALYLSEC